MQRSRTDRPTGLAVVCMGLLFVASCSDAADNPDSEEQRLLDRAILALWGDVDPSAVDGIRIRSRVYFEADTEGSPDYELETSLGVDDNYREVKTWVQFGIREIFGTDGTKVWASIDGTAVPLSEAEENDRRLQPLLFSMSKLIPLKDAKAFRLDYTGPVTLEEGTEVLRLVVEPRENDGLSLFFDFDPESALVSRVTLTRKALDEPMSLELSDYRAVDGVQIAHRLVGRRGKVVVSTELRDQVEVSPRLDPASFRAPLDLNRDAIIRKDSLGGHMAMARHDKDPANVTDTIDRLKDWVGDHDLRITGPLAVLRGARSGVQRVDLRVCIGVQGQVPVEEQTAESGLTLESLEPRPAFCLTHVGEVPTEELLARVTEALTKEGFEATGDSLEILFSPDRRTRQIQVPVREN